MICEIIMDACHKLIPKVIRFQKKDSNLASKPLEDMHPLMERREFKNNMIIKTFEEE